MATTAADEAPPYTPAAIETLGPEDFETASVRSAAPSYTSDAPSYHTIAPNPEPLPPYSPPARPAAPAAGPSAPTPRTSVSSLLDLGSAPPTTTSTSNSTPAAGRRPQGGGLPPVPSGPLPPRPPDTPSLSQFRIPPWSSVASNPNARIYHNVALRRARAAAGGSGGGGSGSSSSSSSSMDSLRRAVLERIEEEEGRNRVRPLEDPYLVGEEAAAQARAERLARENGDEILIREDRRWDWFLAQMKDREEREKSWKRLRRDIDKRSTTRLAFRIGARF